MNQARVRTLFIVLLVIFPFILLQERDTFGSEVAGQAGRTLIEIEAVDLKSDEVEWLVKLIQADMFDGEKVIIHFSSGQVHQSIDMDQEAGLVEETSEGYLIQLAEGYSEYRIQIKTSIQHHELEKLSLGVSLAGERTNLSEEKVVALPIAMDQQTPVQGEEEDQTEEEATMEEVEQEAGGKEDKVLQNDRSDVESMPNNQEVSDQALALVRSSKPTAVPGMKSGSAWPAPGSVKIDKQARAMPQFGEWEIKLSVEGKDIRTSSDIVLVFDRSNSMYPSRLSKAKQAAKQFVHELLDDERSTVRIALVPFGTNADSMTDFQTFDGKEQLLRAIDAIRVTGGSDGGTNIQAGLMQAGLLLQDSTADLKSIVLLSDGAPTYSFKASGATSYEWPNRKYRFLLSGFTGSRIGSGSSYFLSNRDAYRVDDYSVHSNGIATLSTAKHIMDGGIGIYSIGLEVGNDQDAVYVLRNSQNKGYYTGGEDDLRPIFAEIAASIRYAARDARVTDPLGDMFQLVQEGRYGGKDAQISHGDLDWNPDTNSFTWKIGNIKENEQYTLTYRVVLTCEQGAQLHEQYPTNKETLLHYKKHDGESTQLSFPIPKVGLETGKIISFGYRVNLAGDPIDQEGKLVSNMEEAQELYRTVYGEALPIDQSHLIYASDLSDEYTLHVGKNPTEISFTKEACLTVPFGYVKTSEWIAGDVTAKYVDEAGVVLATEEIFSGRIGDAYETVQKEISGYEFLRLDDDSAAVRGVFKEEAQVVIYVYKPVTGSITIKKVASGNHAEGLADAYFSLRDEEGKELATGRTNEAGILLFDGLALGKYQVIETKAPDGYSLLTQAIDLELQQDELHVEIVVENSLLAWEIPKTGGPGQLGFLAVGVFFMVASSYVIFRKHKMV